ncbi:MAG: hypothetical protein FWC93_07190 [Defluviitaleaceae bacterium]|nr:hypothetical protein [Defluviitaleaceae bacterium]
MDNRNKAKINFLIMIAPMLLPVAFFLIMFGESISFFLIPLVVFMCMAFSLSKRLSVKDAISYPFVQYPFLLLVIYLLNVYSRVGLGFILIFPMIFMVNTAIGYVYFRFAKNKRWFTKVLVLLVTLLVTLAIYSEETGGSILSRWLYELMS